MYSLRDDKRLFRPMKRRYVLLTAFVLLAVAILSIQAVAGGKKLEASFENQEGERVDVKLEVANSSSERKKGLMNRPYLPAKQGMIFVFRSNGQKSFWMKNTYVPLDMIFLSEDLTIKNIEQAEPQPFAPESQLRSYKSEGDAMYVIEMRKGFAARHDLEKGDKFVPGPKLQGCCINR